MSTTESILRDYASKEVSAVCTRITDIAVGTINVLEQERNSLTSLFGVVMNSIEECSEVLSNEILNDLCDYAENQEEGYRIFECVDYVFDYAIVSQRETKADKSLQRKKDKSTV